MRGRRYAVGQRVLDRDRQAHGVVVGVYPSPLVVRLVDASGFQWIARTVACEELDAQPTVRVPAGRVRVDVPPMELRVGDQVPAGWPPSPTCVTAPVPPAP